MRPACSGAGRGLRRVLSLGISGWRGGASLSIGGWQPSGAAARDLAIIGKTRRLLKPTASAQLCIDESDSKRTTTRQQLDCAKTCLIAKERCSVSRWLDDSPLGSLLSTRSTGGRLKMVVRKLKAAIYECVLAHSLCNAVTSTGPCGTPFRRRADFVLAQFLRLLSLMPRRLPLAASDMPSRQPKCGASARQVYVRLRRPLGEGRGASQCRAPNPDAGILFGSCEKRESRLV